MARTSRSTLPSSAAKTAKTQKPFWQKDWALGVLILLALLVMDRSSTLLAGLERAAYDWGVQLNQKTPNDKIAIIAIDDASIDKIGRWPWSRDIHAELLTLLQSAKPKLIGHTTFFFEPQQDPGLAYIRKIHPLATKLAETEPVPADLQALLGLVQEAQTKLDTDKALTNSLQTAGNVVLPLSFTLGEPLGKPNELPPPAVSRFSFTTPQQSNEPSIRAVPASAMQFPLTALAEQAVGLGHLSFNLEVDGAARTDALLIQYYEQFYPSFALQIAMRSLNLQLADMQVIWGEAIRLGKLSIPTDSEMQMRPHFYQDSKNRAAFSKDSFFDVLSGKIPLSKYTDKIILIGPTATGLGSSMPTPTNPAMAPVEILAHQVSSLLSGHFYIVPFWISLVELLIISLTTLYLVILLPRLSAKAGAMVTAVIALSFLVSHFSVMLVAGIWIKLMFPLVLLLCGHLALTTKHFLQTEAGKVKADAESAESNRMLALAFQGQGQLDMAWDKFRKCPLDQSLLDNLYNLALDFERKRQFNKAQAVYEYMAAFNPNFRDLSQRLNRAKDMAETVILGGGNTRSQQGTLVNQAGGVEKPMLGRYQVEKELGKGAMGVVYQGRDPKIGRIVAIKTLALAQEFEEDELAEVKTRFFREAETAGRLNHPNIVTIYDAGEEHDLCYIAMELLRGKDLVPHTKPGQLLPTKLVLTMIARVAQALSYAHKQQIVHRDIKPANLMFDQTDEIIKVTDFGIARITDSSKTKTGMVLGTPSYMSPEQLSGQKIDGRSDLYSLTVTLYQLLCGKLPFVGESMAQLMFKIANDPAPDIRDVRPDLADCIWAILEKGMAKNRQARYQDGEEMAAELLACAERLEIVGQ
ncbi:CHASE2 domain-containing serine/threonine-protein kinase [Parvibium lacunae]|uniref:non-specific serine/threonine protein kinase n=1 Tax=Parvibium lacunae TaxID=1888893 RepID=A0A368L1U2_9BURK|nr:serine/threonine-protein kinase [Parvibium lacunae]RCS57527.1 CHASE2 domain-containing protein [Parvibium lacunae]